MSKAILILNEMPKCCEECRLINSHYDNEYGWQTYCGGDYHRIKEKNKKYFCPLKPLPERRYAIQGMKGYSSTVKVCKGWNDCLDEILGGNDD